MSQYQTLATALNYLVKDEQTKQYLLHLADTVVENQRELEDTIENLRRDFSNISAAQAHYHNQAIDLQEKLTIATDELKKLKANQAAMGYETFRVELSSEGANPKNKIGGIKEIREGTGMGLAQAKELIELIAQQGCAIIKGDKHLFTHNRFVVLGA